MDPELHKEAAPEKIIDVEQVIASKSPALLRWMPGFALRYIKKILHEEDINYELITFRHLDPVQFCKHIIQEKFAISTQSTGLENIPKEGGAILVANHPLGGMDALSLVIELAKVRRDFTFIVNDILLHLPALKPIFKGVNTMGKNSKEVLQEINALFASDQLTVLFPAGLVSRRQPDGHIRDMEWRKTFITQARNTGKPVLPVLIDAPPLTNRFYGINKWRNKLGVKANLELFYLVDEQYKSRGGDVHIHFGSPIPADTFDRSRRDWEWAEWVKEQMYSLSPI